MASIKPLHHSASTASGKMHDEYEDAVSVDVDWNGAITDSAKVLNGEDWTTRKRRAHFPISLASPRKVLTI